MSTNIEFDPDTLVELSDVVIDTSLPKEERIMSYLEQIKNPYAFKVNGVVVTVSYNESGPTLQEAIEAYLKLQLS